MKIYRWLLVFSLFLLVAAPTSSLFSQAATETVSGNVYEDADGDGERDENEDGGEATVSIVDENGRVIAQVTTYETGNYVFPNIPVGTRVRLVITYKETNLTVRTPLFAVTATEGDFVYNVPVVTIDTMSQFAFTVTQPVANPSNTDGEEVSKFAP